MPTGYRFGTIAKFGPDSGTFKPDKAGLSDTPWGFTFGENNILSGARNITMGSGTKALDVSGDSRDNIVMGYGCAVSGSYGNVVVGYLGTVSTGSYVSTVLGYSHAKKPLCVSAGYDAIASGSYSIAIGNSARTFGENTVAIGSAAEATGQSALGMAGGDAIADYSVSIGSSSDARTKYGIAIGRHADNKVGRLSAITFGTTFSSAFCSKIAGTVRTTDATPTIMYLASGNSTDGKIAIESNQTSTICLYVTAEATASTDIGCYKFEGVISRNYGANATVKTINKTVIHEDEAAWDVALTADTTAQSLVITVTGKAAETVDWHMFGEIMDQ